METLETSRSPPALEPERPENEEVFVIPTRSAGIFRKGWFLDRACLLGWAGACVLNGQFLNSNDSDNLSRRFDNQLYI